MAKKNQFERLLVRRPCVSYLRKMLAYKQLRRYPALYWQCSPDHGSVGGLTAGHLKLDGYEKGVYDMTIIACNEDGVRVWLIEFKHGNNKYTPEQKAIAEMFAPFAVECMKIYTPDEFMEFVTRELI